MPTTITYPGWYRHETMHKMVYIIRPEVKMSTAYHAQANWDGSDRLRFFVKLSSLRPICLLEKTLLCLT